jgi:Cu/Ag efflux pump CusA
MISEIFIDRPRLSIVISTIITLAGLIALTQIPVAQFPDIVPPQVSVTASYQAPGRRSWNPLSRNQWSPRSTAWTTCCT